MLRELLDILDAAAVVSLSTAFIQAQNLLIDDHDILSFLYMGRR